MAYQPQERAAEQAYQTTTPLGIGGTYDSGIIDLRGWTQVDTRITADQDGTITIRWYSDAAGTDQVRLLTIPYSAADGFQLFSAPAFTPFNRYEYTNGGVAQTDFFFETKLLHVPLSPQVLGATAFIAEGMVTQLNRSIITGRQPDGDFVNAKADGTGFTETVPLGAGATYTSPWVDTDGYNGIEIFLASDQLSQPGGVQVQFTDDVQAAVPVVRAIEAFSYAQADVDRGSLELFFQPRLDGLRLVYTNGTTPQGSFFAQSDLRINRDATRLDSSGTTIVGDFNVEVALGNIPNYINSTKFGLVKAIDSADTQPITVWALADDGRTPLRVARKTFQTVANNIFVASNNVADAGVEVTLFINNATNNLVTATVTLDGADGRTPVDTGISGLDCNTAFVSGNNQTLAGDVYVTSGSDFTDGVPNNATTVLAFIPVGDQRTQQAVFRVPDDQTLIINNVHSTVTAGTANGATTVVFRILPPNGSWYTLRPYNVSTSIGLERKEVIALDPGSLVEFYIEDVEGNNLNTLVLFNFNLITT
jgi:hypothetical protein